MLFNSWEFVLLFLPAVVLGYFFLQSRRWPGAAKLWLLAASLFFYAWWNVSYLPLILGSILFNFAIGARLVRGQAGESGASQRAARQAKRRWLLAFGVFANLAVLAWFKYSVFVVQNVNLATGAEYVLPSVLLPLAISFFTFQQIAYLVDSHRGEVAEHSLLNYAIFVTFFPQLIAGPIVHHREMMPQFASPERWTPQHENLLRGLFLFGLGLFKKVAIADTFAPWADAGFDGGEPLHFFSAWAATLSYSFQIYFDFSAYCDMAMGAALLFNIRLPLNFNSPYKALDIQDFWRRWHITLGRFLRDYLYIPLGGSRRGKWRTHLNLVLTFLLGGLWHGAAWMFVLWGAAHGLALVLHRLWRGAGLRLPMALAWLCTFVFVCLSWVLFRARSMDDALRMYAGLFDLGSIWNLAPEALPVRDLAWGGWLSDRLLQLLPVGLVGQAPVFLAIALAFVLIRQRHAVELSQGRLGVLKLAGGALLFAVGLAFCLASASAVFLYFNF